MFACPCKSTMHSLTDIAWYNVDVPNRSDSECFAFRYRERKMCFVRLIKIIITYSSSCCLRWTHTQTRTSTWLSLHRLAKFYWILLHTNGQKVVSSPSPFISYCFQRFRNRSSLHIEITWRILVTKFSKSKTLCVRVEVWVLLSSQHPYSAQLSRIEKKKRNKLTS